MSQVDSNVSVAHTTCENNLSIRSVGLIYKEPSDKRNPQKCETKSNVGNVKKRTVYNESPEKPIDKF